MVLVVVVIWLNVLLSIVVGFMVQFDIGYWILNIYGNLLIVELEMILQFFGFEFYFNVLGQLEVFELVCWDVNVGDMQWMIVGVVLDVLLDSEEVVFVWEDVLNGMNGV